MKLSSSLQRSVLLVPAGTIDAELPMPCRGAPSASAASANPTVARRLFRAQARAGARGPAGHSK